MNDTFITIATFQYSSEAQIIKGRLESEGVEVFLADNYTIDTDPLVSNAIGGVKLKVLTQQALKAQYILNSIQKKAIDDDGNIIKCPNCKSESVALFSTIKSIKSFFSFILGLLFSVLPLHTKHKYKCENCNTEFDLKEGE